MAWPTIGGKDPQFTLEDSKGNTHSKDVLKLLQALETAKRRTSLQFAIRFAYQSISDLVASGSRVMVK